MRLSSFYFLLFGSLLVSCNKNSEDRISKNSSTKFQQYYNQGEQLYLKHCSNCHQKNGKGLGLVYPPLNESDYMDKNLKDVLCLIRYGKEGELIVNGKAYNQRMPPMALLSDLEIAEISTYIYNSWSHEKGIIDVKEASDMLQDCN
ncbi:cytochrome c [Fulvivirgaceae bacterium PWU20]|uniref:Cytochrome c n=1 Tax=Chryseosolibacter indicus TaxID=2782351 RepID=A0ABS5VKW3_9BACT|nr:cytochrome c [Chryseosolibacter indicus]